MSIVASERIKRTQMTDWQPSEEEEQAAVMEWAMLMERQYPELALLFHIPNGADRHPAVAAKLKRQGVKAGVPDLFLPVARGGWHGLWVEMKRRKGGKVSAEQRQWLQELTYQHYYATVAQGAEEACDVIFKYLTEEAEL